MIDPSQHGFGPDGGHPGGGRIGPEPERGRDVASLVSIAQFAVTVVILGGVATLAYLAGLQSGRAHGDGEGRPRGPATAVVDVPALLAETPELLATGKSVFDVNCASCHGTSGKGDGPAAVALNPKPRDFTSGYWKFGGGVARIVQTITEGSPGTGMTAFPGIPIEDRFALAHHIRSFGAKDENDTPEQLAWLDQFGGGPNGADTTGGTAPGQTPAAGPTIPIERAMALLAEAPSRPAPAPAGAPDSSEAGMLYASRCASCHGVWGEGGVPTRMLGSAPYARVTTRSFASSGAAQDGGAFQRVILRGIPGLMPGNADLTSEQIRALFTHTQMLRARQESAARTRS